MSSCDGDSRLQLACADPKFNDDGKEFQDVDMDWFLFNGRFMVLFVGEGVARGGEPTRGEVPVG